MDILSTIFYGFVCMLILVGVFMGTVLYFLNKISETLEKYLKNK